METRVLLTLDRRWRTKDGKYVIKLNVRHKGKQFIMTTGITVKEDNWNEKERQVVGRDADLLNMTLGGILLKAQNVILKLNMEGKLDKMSGRELCDILSGKKVEEEKMEFYDFFLQRINMQKNPRNKEIYQITLKRIEKFCNAKDLKFSDIDYKWLTRFDSFMSLSAPSVNTRSIYLRTLRAVINAAITEELTTVYPFRRFKIKREATMKRGLYIKELKQIFNMKVSKNDERYLDCFKLIFYLIGINMVDLSRLTERNIENDRIVYRRAKTHKMYSIEIMPEAMEIINRYKGDNHLLDFFDKAKDYRNFLHKMNDRLKPYAKRLGLNITSYTARASWATIAAEMDIPVETISRALGHEHGLAVTNIYIKYDYRKVDVANRRVIDAVLK